MDRITTQKQVDGPLAAKLHGLGQNLWLDVQSATSRQWLFIWKKDGRQRTKGLGSATGTKGAKISLAEARRRADRLRASIADGIDPVLEERKETTLFGNFADQVLKKLAPEFRHPKTMKNWKLHLDEHAKPLRSKPVAAITSADIAAVIEPLREKPETARQLRGRIETVLRHARTAGLRSGENPASREALSMPRRRKNSIRHHPAMPYETVPAFVAVLDPTMNGHAALQLLILTATRTNEVAGAEWREFDLAGRLWTIPAARVKNGADHHVPLTDEMLALLAALPRQEGAERLFPACRPHTMLDALQALPGCAGYTVHGFRSAFRDWCGNETSFPREVVEETYGHEVGNEVERAYRRRKGLEKRRKVLEAWNGYVCGGKVLPFARRVA